MEDIRRAIESRINIFNTLSLEHLTPLLRKQLDHAVKLHREALKSPDPYLEDLAVLYNQFTKRWTRVYGDSTARAFLSQDIIQFHQFLVGKLLEDYANEPYSINKWVLDQVKCLVEQDRHVLAKDSGDMGTAYSNHVIYPLEEMMLSRDYAENKLRAVASGEERRGNDIQILIGRRDWPSLATALTNDRDPAHKLFLQQPYNTTVFNKDTYQRILQGIDEIERKYVRSSDSSTNLYAREIIVGQAQDPDQGPSPKVNLRSGGLFPRSDLAWIKVLVNGFVGVNKPKTRASSDDDWDEANTLNDSKKAD